MDRWNIDRWNMVREQIECLTPSEASLLSVAMAKAPPWLADRTILLTRAGSRAYGTSVPGSDSDFRGVAIAPLKYYLGFTQGFARFVFDGQVEGEIEDIRVFMRAACNGEPQVLAVLFCDDCDVVRATESGRALRAARDRFLSKRMAKPFAGHARSIVTRWEKGQPVTSKEAATAVRLVRMLAEILVAGKVCVRRHDADELLAIRRAERPVEIERALQEAVDGLARVESWARNSTLPEQPDRDWLDGFCAAQVSRAGGERNMVNDAGDRLPENRNREADRLAAAHARIAALPPEQRREAMIRASRSYSAPRMCVEYDGCRREGDEIVWPDGERWPTRSDAKGGT